MSELHTCPECRGEGSHERHEICMGCPGSDFDGHQHEPWQEPCRVCRGTGTIDAIQHAVYVARGGAAPVTFRGFA